MSAAQERRYVLWPDDAERGWRIGKLAADGLRQAAREMQKDGKPREVVIRQFEPPRTDPQRKTLWMWCGEVASELSIRTGKRWHKNDVYELLVIERFMPLHDAEVVDLETGEVRHRRKRTSEATRAEISEAMERFLAWIYEQGIEVTCPEERTW